MNHIGLWLFALFSLAVLLVTFYFPMVGLGQALDRTSSLTERWNGVLWVLPSVSLLVFLVGMLPLLRGPALLGLGIGATALLLPPVIACARIGFPAAFGCIAALAYSGLWWQLAKSRMGS